MPKKLTQEEFVERATKVHNGKYDYSKVVYVNNYTKVCIVCPIHGEFSQSPMNHLAGGGCSECGRQRTTIGNRKVRPNTRKKIIGIGINDLKNSLNAESTRVYNIWRQMLKRCYDESSQKKQPTYRGCSVCEEWHYFTNFYNWYILNYVKGWCLDKDILVKGNKIYSPETCCFVPNEINTIFNKHKNKRCKLGVCGVFMRRNRFYSVVSMFGRNVSLGGYESIEEAKSAYKDARETYIKRVAEIWKDKISTNVYNALINYEFSFED